MIQQIPSNLQNLIDDALVGVRNRTNTATLPDFLLTISDLFGHLVDNGKVLDRSQQRRLMLTILSIQHVLPVWADAWPNDSTPQRLLREIEQVILHDFTSSKIKAIIEHIEVWLNRYHHEISADEYPSLMIGFSLANLSEALLAISDGVIRDDRSSNQRATVAILTAAETYANGPPIIAPTFDQDKWFAYWEVWLTTIISEAWAAIPNDSAIQ